MVEVLEKTTEKNGKEGFCGGWMWQLIGLRVWWVLGGKFWVAIFNPFYGIILILSCYAFIF